MGNGGAGRKADGRSIEDQVLDALLECVIERGILRTTVSEVARRANLSRPTIYRRWPDLTAMVGSLITRETSSIVADLPVPDGTRATLVERIVSAARVLAAHPLLNAVREADREFLGTYVFNRIGQSQKVILRVLQTEIAELRGAGGQVRPGSNIDMGSMVLLMGQSVVMSKAMISSEMTEAALFDEFRSAVDAYLRP